MNTLGLYARFPKREKILALFSFAAFLVYGRILFVYAWKLPSWLNYLTLGEIFTVLSYSLFTALLESLLLTFVLALIAFALPSRWLRDGFAAQGVWILAVWIASWSLYFNRMAAIGIEGGFALLEYLYPWFAATVLLAALAAFASARVTALTRFGLWLADRTLVFLFILVPASLVGGVVVLIRNLP